MFGFSDFHTRSGVELAGSLVAGRRAPGVAGFLQALFAPRDQGLPGADPAGRLRVPCRLPKMLTVEQVSVILVACDCLRDRLLFALLAGIGMRVGQALGLRHTDFVPRADITNGARAKTTTVTVLPVSVPLVRFYSDYMHREYGELDRDYVFVNLWIHPVGAPLRYQAVAKLVARLRERTGIAFTPHLLRHTQGHREDPCGDPCRGASGGRLRLLTGVGPKQFPPPEV